MRENDYRLIEYLKFLRTSPFSRNTRHEKWTESIAVGSEEFIEKVESLMGALATGRKSMEAEDFYQLREPAVPHIAHLEGKKGDIGPENAYFWDVDL